DRIGREQRSGQPPFRRAQCIQVLPHQLAYSMVRNRHYIAIKTPTFGYILDKTTVFARNLVSKVMSREDRPRIGITTSPRRGGEHYDSYKRSVEPAAAHRVDLPPGTAPLPELDGLLLPGGWDFDPALYGEEPDP